MSNIKWKNGTVISVETRKNVFTLAQMIEEPYLYFFDIYHSSHDWNIHSLESIKTMFCVSVLQQFIKNSNVKKMNITPKTSLEFPSYWIERNHEAQMYTIWENTTDEMTFAISRKGGRLIKRDIDTKPQEYIKVEDIICKDNKTINNYETTALRSYPELNERLFLCYSLHRKVDPLKDLIFQRPMIKEYKVYMQIFTGKGSKYYK